jgi:hypothetical protein
VRNASHYSRYSRAFGEMVSRSNQSAHQPAPPCYRLGARGVFANVARYGVAGTSGNPRPSNMCTAPIQGVTFGFGATPGVVDPTEAPNPPPVENDATLTATFDAMTVTSTVTDEFETFDIDIFPASFVSGAAAIEQGLGGSTHRTWYLRIVPQAGGLEHIWHTHNDGSTGGGVDTGIDPSTYVAELSGSTGTVVAMAAGVVTAATRATSIAAAMETRPWCASAIVAGADNPDGSRTVTVSVVGGDTTIALGSRSWAARGAAGLWGSHQFRRALAGEIAGSADTAITRNLAQAINTPPATAQFNAVSMLLGATVSTTAANIPRIYLRAGNASTTIPGPNMIFDFGQIPVSEMVGGRRARINLTSAQAVALRAALDAATGQLWICCKAAATTQNTTLPNGGSWNGELADLNLRVDTVTSGDGSTAAPGAWNNTGAASANALLAIALHYQVDPAGTGESYPVCGSLRDLSTAPNEVTLPNTVTRQVASTITGHQGAHIHTVEAQLTDAGPRYGMKGTSDTTTITADPDDPNLTGATTLYDFGQTVTTGTVVMTAPTGDSSIPVPAVFIVEFKGTGLRGFGWTTLPSGNTPIQANDFIYANGGVGSVDGTNQHELDYAGESGDPTTAFVTPIAGATTQPNNLPALRITLRRSADTVT